MAKNLTDLTARTATADTDLMHINSGGTDYKETKADFTKNLSKYVNFATDSDITSQIDALGSGVYSGVISSSGHQSETGVPQNAPFYVEAVVGSTGAHAIINLSTASTTVRRWYKEKVNGTWFTNWKELPTQGDFNYAFSTSTLLTTQVESLPAGTYFGSIASSGHQTETGVPMNASFFVEAHVYSSTYMDIILISMGNSSRRFILSKGSSGWASAWRELPGMGTPNVSVGTINASSSLTITANYAIVFLYLNTAQTAILGCRSGAIAVFQEGASIGSYITWSVSSTTFTFTNTTTTSGIRYCIIQI